MSARAWNAGLGLAFAVLGCSLAAAAWRLPDGLAGIPGPGAFPLLVGVLMAALGSALAVFAREERAPFWPHAWNEPPVRRVLLLLLLLAVYLALWEAVPFVFRTPVLLVAVYRTVGEPWLRSAAIALSATAVLWIVFQFLLRVRL